MSPCSSRGRSGVLGKDIRIDGEGVGNAQPVHDNGADRIGHREAAAWSRSGDPGDGAALVLLVGMIHGQAVVLKPSAGDVWPERDLEELKRFGDDVVGGEEVIPVVDELMVG